MRARLIAALAVAAGLSGCADNNSSVEMYGVCSYPDTCEFGSSCDALLLGDLWVDLAATNQLDIFVELRNQLPDNADASAGRTNTNDARLESVEISYEGGVSAPASSIAVNGIVPANGSSVVLMYAVAPPAIGASTGLSPSGTALKDQAAAGPFRTVASIVAKGHYLGGGSFETGPWKVPIQVCSGCAAATDYCPAGQVVASVCPQVGQIGTATCEDATAP